MTLKTKKRKETKIEKLTDVPNSSWKSQRSRSWSG